MVIIWSVIILVIKQIGLPLRGRPILLITHMITNRIGLHSVLLPLLIIYSFTIIVIIIVPLPEHPLVQEFPDSAHVRYIEIPMWL